MSEQKFYISTTIGFVNNLSINDMVVVGEIVRTESSGVYLVWVDTDDDWVDLRTPDLVHGVATLKRVIHQLKMKGYALK